MSRSISARFGPLLNYMERNNQIRWQAIPENNLSASKFKDFDAVLFNKHTSTRALDLLRIANAMGKTTIYDLDDWILDLPDYSVTNLTEDILANIVEMLREARHVSVSNPILAKKLSSLRPDAHFLTNGFDHDAIPAKPDSWHEAGSAKILFSNTDGLKLIKFRQEFIETLRDFMKKHPEVTLDFWGDSFPEMHTIDRLNEKGFLPNHEYKCAIRDGGYRFAVVPLGGLEDPDTLFFNSCKSCIKYIDYGSLGIPAIYSDSPVYSNEILNFKTGIIADNIVNSWRSSMENLYSNSVLRQAIRTNAYSDVLARFNLSKPSSVLVKLLSI